MKSRRLPTIGCTALLTAAVVLPAGIFVGRAFDGTADEQSRQSRREGRPPGSKRPAVRDPYSAQIQADPFVLDRHRNLTEALERGCAQAGENCAEAKQARSYLERQASE